MRLLVVILLVAGIPPSIHAAEGDWWRHWPEGTGQLVDCPDSPWVQSLSVGGYAHLQSSFVDGRSEGEDFWYSRASDLRRVRAVIKGQALQAVDFRAHFNMVRDEGRNGGGVEFDYFGIFSGDVGVDFAKWFDLGDVRSLQFGYGKRKLVELSEEVDTSVNSILTVERSALAGFVAPFRRGTAPTGGWVRMTRGNELISFGIFTTDSSLEFGDWDAGTVMVAGWRHDFSEAWCLDEAIVSVSAAWQDIEQGDEPYSRWEWVVTPWVRLRNDRWGLRVSGALGSNESVFPNADGAFYGLVVLPSWELVEGHLTGVLRYQLMGSEGARGVALPSRYAREAGLPANEGLPSLARGTGDFHESVYAGLVWTITPKHFHLLFGMEWERLKSREMQVYRGLTAWFSTRVVF